MPLYYMVFKNLSKEISLELRLKDAQVSCLDTQQPTSGRGVVEAVRFLAGRIQKVTKRFILKKKAGEAASKIFTRTWGAQENTLAGECSTMIGQDKERAQHIKAELNETKWNTWRRHKSLGKAEIHRETLTHYKKQRKRTDHDRSKMPMLLFECYSALTNRPMNLWPVTQW